MATLRQRTSFGPGIYRGHKFDLDRLRTFVEGTNRAIAAGVPIPLLLRHAPINADDAATQAFASKPDTGAGFLTKVEQEADGNIAWEANVPDAVANAAKEGALRYTSPEFRSHYESEKAGVYSGPIIRHFAFTPTPGNPHQGAIESVALSEEVWQFEESDVIPFAERGDDSYTGSFVKPTVAQPNNLKSGSDKSIDWDTLTPDVKSKILGSIKAGNNSADIQKLYSISGACAECGIAEYKKFKERNDMSQHAEFPVDKKKGIDNKEDDVEVQNPGEGDVNLEVAQEPMGDQPNPDMPPKATDKSKLAAIIAGLKQRGMVVPSDWDPDKDGAMDILLATLNTAIEAENKAKAEESEEDDDDENVTDALMPFAEMSFNSPNTPLKHILKYGYSRDKSKLRNAIYKHSSGKHEIHYHGGGGDAGNSWTHVDRSGAKGKTYHGKDSDLESYLKKLHSTQHTETKPTGDYVMQFTEEELASMPASLKAKLDAEASARKAAEAKASQFEEANKTSVNTAAKDKAIAFIESSKLPSGMKVELLAAYDTTQFEEGIESPVYTNVQVAELFSKYIPKHLQFDEDDEDIVEGDKPKGVHEQFFEGDTPTGHVSAERARELVDTNPFINNRMTQQAKPLQSVSDLVKAENERVPNNVRGSGY